MEMNLVEVAILCCICVIFGYYKGWKSAYEYNEFRVIDVFNVLVHEENEMFYFYELNTNKFLMQHKNFEDGIRFLQTHNPKAKIVVSRV